MLLGRRRRGFYIDVGAWDPVQDSVTKYFYDRGWHGINVEPNPALYARLCAARPRDVNLEVALSDAPGELELHVIGTTGLSTFAPEFAGSSTAWAVENRGVDGAHAVRVTVTTLSAICREHVPAGTQIDFLKVDVEGWEERALRGGDWSAYRPTVLCIEAVEPLSDRPNWASWDAFVRAQDYDFLDFDGLNRWYRRRER
ncbi:MAG TPA: FkbM family methyltransferase [Candidatus Sulfotelmatobacter sp.]|nr:FkbM family methyltransferase [Candidatus Sulfotelmatobacter sp.]